MSLSASTNIRETHYQTTLKSETAFIREILYQTTMKNETTLTYLSSQRVLFFNYFYESFSKSQVCTLV